MAESHVVSFSERLREARQQPSRETTTGQNGDTDELLLLADEAHPQKTTCDWILCSLFGLICCPWTGIFGLYFAIRSKFGGESDKDERRSKQDQRKAICLTILSIFVGITCCAVVILVAANIWLEDYEHHRREFLPPRWREMEVNGESELHPNIDEWLKKVDNVKHMEQDKIQNEDLIDATTEATTKSYDYYPDGYETGTTSSYDDNFKLYGNDDYSNEYKSDDDEQSNLYDPVDYYPTYYDETEDQYNETEDPFSWPTQNDTYSDGVPEYNEEYPEYYPDNYVEQPPSQNEYNTYDNYNDEAKQSDYFEDDTMKERPTYHDAEQDSVEVPVHTGTKENVTEMTENYDDDYRDTTKSPEFYENYQDSPNTNYYDYEDYNTPENYQYYDNKDDLDESDYAQQLQVDPQNESMLPVASTDQDNKRENETRHQGNETQEEDNYSYYDFYNDYLLNESKEMDDDSEKGDQPPTNSDDEDSVARDVSTGEITTPTYETKKTASTYRPLWEKLGYRK